MSTLLKWLQRIVVIPMVLFSVTGLAASADMVVIRSQGTEFIAGQTLSQQQTIDLTAAAELTVVFNSGQVLTVRGPYHDKLQDKTSATAILQQETHIVETLAQFLQESQTSATTLRAQVSDSPDDIWAIDVSTNKRHYCVTDGRDIVLWRSDNDSGTASNLLIKHKDSGREVQMTWPANQTTVTWPRSLPIVYGDTYTVEVTSRRGNASFKKLVLYQLPSTLPTQSHQIVWMVGRGCIPQANLLLAKLR